MSNQSRYFFRLRTAGPISPVSEEASISEDSRRCSTESGSTSVNNVSVSHPKPSRVQAKVHPSSILNAFKFNYIFSL